MKKTLFLFLLLISYSLFAQVNLTQGLVAYYPFNGNANDASGNNINAVTTNATLTTDRIGTSNSAYYFDGATSYIQLPYSNLYNFAPQDSFSISVWVLPDQGYTWPAQALVVKSPSNPDFTLSNWNYGAYILNYKAMTGFAANNFLNGSTAFTSTSCWYNIIVTYKNGIWKLYVNGVLEASDLSQTKFILQDGPASPIVFGKKGESFGDWYKGKMDEVRIYNRVLNMDEVTALYEPGCTISCNNWLQTQAIGQSVTVGDLDVSGDQMTIEANFSCTSFPLSGANLWEDIVSKHSNTTDANYVLRMDLAAITTTTGHYLLSPVCNNLKLNKIFHVALVYNGSVLKFYRNGYLLGQMPVTGNLILNNWMTTIGDYAVNNPVGTNFFGFINEVRIWNVARTQTQLRTYMNTSLPNPTTQPGLLGYYTFDNLLNKQGNPAFNGTLNGGATINNTVPDCTFMPDSCQSACDTNSDFNFNQSACDPLSINFLPAATTSDSIGWDFGDGNILSNNPNPTHLYANNGNYIVKMIVHNSTCTDTVSKTISLSIVQDNQLIKTNDTTICIGTTKQLLTAPSINFCWSPTNYLDNPNSSVPVTSAPQNITYYYTALIAGYNLITNGDFNSGITGFTSGYQYSSSGLSPGVYFVGTNPRTWNPGISSCIDHTSGNGNMMLVNGDEMDGKKIWSETIPVQPNTNYVFSTWIENVTNTNPARIQFSINGIPLGNVFQATTTICLWEQFYILWNSGNNTTVDISVINKNTIPGGNSFALDDISFAPTYMKRDSVIITVDSPFIKTNNDTTLCEGGSAQLNTIGASSYIWSPITGLSNSNISNPVASPTTTTQYVVAGTNSYGCSSTDTVLITVNSKPVITKSNDTLICKNSSIQLFAGGGSTYSWSPAASLNDPNISNPLATPATNTEYYVTVTDANSCRNKDSIQVNIRPEPVFIISPSTKVCENSSTQLSAAGGDIYSWQPSASLNNANISNPISTTSATTAYSVQITDTVCNNTTTLSTTVTVMPLPIIQVSKSNDIDCSNDASQLNATGGILYNWSPVESLDNPNIQNPTARPTTTTLYSVKGTDASGCSNSDTITVYVTGTNKGGYLMPNAFTPNHDGKNDCYGVKYWGVILELDFSIYNRWGQKVFQTTTPGECWDGTYNGKPQNPDIYIYMIKAKTSCDQEVFRKGTFTLIR